jgi:UDP-2,3-diacylglucosamine pyrophosphatase LpxH
MKKSTATILALTGSILIFAFLAWAFNQHGMIGLFRVNGIFRILFPVMGGAGVVVLLLALLRQRLEARLNPKGQHRLSIVILILALPAIIVPTAAFSYANDTFSPGIGTTQPQLMITDSTGAYGIPDLALVFNTRSANANELNWGEDGATDFLYEEQLTRQHVFMLTDPKPDSTYWYQLNQDEAVYFDTPVTEGSLHIAVASDAHFGRSVSRSDLAVQMLSDIADSVNDYDMFFFLGDLVEYGFLNEQWREAYNAFAPTTSVIPVRYTAGNHDTLFAGFGNYKNYCYPEGMALETGSQLWYQVDIGRVHILILDLEWSAESYTADQAAWLETQLENIPDDDWNIVMSHGYYYSSGVELLGWQYYDNTETIEPLTPLFEEHGVDLVLSGHNHHMELLENYGVTYAICGAFGGLPDPERTYTSPASVWYRSGEYGFIDMTINGDKCTLIFRDHDYEVLKTYTFDKTG